MSIVKKRLCIQGMHCSSCAMAIDFDLEDLDGVITVKTQYANQCCDIAYDEEKLALQDIIQRIQQSGYTVDRVLEI